MFAADLRQCLGEFLQFFRKPGHIGVYIGNGEVIEAMDTRYGVVKTKLQGRGWTHWLEVSGIKYD